MYKIEIPCDFSGKKAVIPFYIGTPSAENHPIHHQATWLSKERGGTVPEKFMHDLAEMHKIALKNGLDFQDVCAAAFKESGYLINDTPPDAVDREDVAKNL